MMTRLNWQPHLIGSALRLRPLTEDDFDALFAVAADPLIWEQHPDHKRYTRERFEVYFRSGIESKGALAVIDLKSGQIIGSSRYTDYTPQTSSVEIGYTFLTRPYWGGAFNRELKTLMLNYTFQFVDTVYFVVGENNLRSRKAMKKIGAVEVSNSALTPVSGDLTHNVIFEIKKSDWQKQPHILPKFNQHPLDTFGLKLEPVTEAHTQGHKQR